ncbi:hypothetical protein N1851_022595 [Merluccius polli]|uniref:FXYD domain-containing ion transport regulator n=1 Tax=Merluccius polli TaxID=89951 RepID=A0AA47NXE3_MERPO|nr:hypothetical protein N1851_022595 [Merluccius polli]
MYPDQSDFDYDYETLRTTGVILATIMFVSGILIALITFTLCPCKPKTKPEIIETKSADYPLKNKARPEDSCVHAFITSRLDDCRGLLAGLLGYWLLCLRPEHVNTLHQLLNPCIGCPYVRDLTSKYDCLAINPINHSKAECRRRNH